MRLFPTPRVFALAAAALAAATTARADTIHFKHGTALECRVVSMDKDKVEINLDGDENKRVILEARNIERVDLDYQSQLDKLAADDWAGHYKLGCWCEGLAEEDLEMRERAIERFEHCRGHDGVPDDVWARLGRLYAKRQPSTPADVEKALENYRKYLELQPDDQTTKDEIARLEGLLPPPPEPVAQNHDNSTVIEGLEIQRWQIESWSNPGTTRLVTDKANEGSRTLEVSVNPGDKDKSAFTMRLGRDLSQYDYISFDAYIPQKFPVTVWAAAIAGPKSIWYEQVRPFTIPPESWSTNLKISFRTPYWKGFEGNTQIGNNIVPELNPVRNLLFIFGNKPQPYKIYLDGVGFKTNAPK